LKSRQEFAFTRKGTGVFSVKRRAMKRKKTKKENKRICLLR